MSFATDFPIQIIHKNKHPNLSSLFDLQYPPEHFYIQGSTKAFEHLSRIPHRGLAIVGTRKPKLKSIHFLESELTKLRHSQLIIISGFALGIDRAAHAIALKSGLPTIAILGAGHNIDYPLENRDLRLQILKSDGLLVSEQSPFTLPRKGTFICRNRIIAAWTKALWMVEAPIKSGALNSASWSNRHSRDIYVTPSFPTDQDYAGNIAILKGTPSFPIYSARDLRMTWTHLEITEQDGTQLSLLQTRASDTGAGTRPNPAALHIALNKMKDNFGSVHLEDLLIWGEQNHWPRTQLLNFIDLAKLKGNLKIKTSLTLPPSP